MPGSTPIYGLPYQARLDAPHGPDLGRLLALATETAIAAVAATVAANAATETAWRPIFAVKAAATPRFSTTSRTLDPELSTPSLPASTTWLVVSLVLATSETNAAGDLEYELRYPTGAKLSWGPLGLAIALPSATSADLNAGNATSADTTSPSTSFTVGCSTNLTSSIGVGILTMDTTPGSLGLAWAQVSSHLDDTILHPGSFVAALRLA